MVSDVPLPLDGLLVLDFSQFLAGPSATLRLADWGWVAAIACALTRQDRLLATLVNVPDRLVPTSLTAAMITTAIRLAKRPYSMAVAPASSEIKRETSIFIASFPAGDSLLVGRTFESAVKGPD